MWTHTRSAIVLAACIAITASSLSVQAATDSGFDDDATITLTVDDIYTIGVTMDWCSVRIEVVGDDVALTEGDVVTVTVEEDDGNLANDLIFETTFLVNAQEAAEELVSRTFNCSDDLELYEMPATNAEIRASAVVDKYECAFPCALDRPETGILNVFLDDGFTPPPSTLSETDTEDDASLTLTTDMEYVVGETTDWCNVRIHVVGNQIVLSSGDQVRVSVFENDALEDEQLFEAMFVVTASEVAEQLVDRTFDCSASLELFEAIGQ